ncbi:uncharacterized protein LOC111613197 [Centruroides sculpturatus]|uniref:uncharacterized protein LOC111613197 n=1 Tax=Centruroides sculpturatus TaxID=218467 RepID=UPI000C6E21ED|nr:uncharacterized protein LOC111613197 [Centruroides sculpturatus]
MLNKYEQCGCLMGTVTVDGKEEELHLWGTRSRSYGTLQTQPSYQHLHLVGLSKTGETVSIGALTVPEVISDLKYGFVTTGSGVLNPIDVSDVSLSRLYLDGLPPTVKVARIRANKRWWKMNINGMDAKTSIGSTYFSELQLSSARLNGKQARSLCIFYHKLRPETIREKHVPRFVPRIKDNERVEVVLVTSLQNSTANQSSILGGKGSSLVNLQQISDIEKSFYVPKGIIVTFNAYRELMRNEELLFRIYQLEDAAWGKSGEDVKEICSQTVKYLEEYSLPISLASALHEKFIEVFGTEYTSLFFAVRSSAQGEDSEDISAAGQMETFLNVTGIQKKTRNRFDYEFLSVALL